jgi:chromosome segregation ATPase
MPDKDEFINFYVQSLQKEIEETAKQKSIASATAAFKDAEIGELKETLVKQQEEMVSQKQIMADSKNDSLKEKDMDIQLLRDKNVSLAEKIDTLHRQGKDKDAIVSDYKTIISEREDMIASLNEQINTNKDTITSLNERLKLKASKPAKPKVEIMNKKKRVRSKLDIFTGA